MSRLNQILKDYPLLEATTSEIESMESSLADDVITSNDDEIQSVSPQYYLRDMFKASITEGPDDDFPPVPEVENDIILDDDEEYDGYKVDFAEARPWTALTQKNIDGRMNLELMAPENLTDAQYKQWVESVSSIMTISRQIRLHQAEIMDTSSGLLIIENMIPSIGRTSEFKSIPEHIPPSPTSDHTTPPSSLRSDTPSQTSSSSMGLPDVSSASDWSGMINKKIRIPPVVSSKSPYEFTLSDLYGSNQAALDYLSGSGMDLRTAVCSGLKQRGIYNRIRIQYKITPEFV
ncbi:phosphoprotein [Isfahan virus]|uniref:Phosphoprotein n=1 Tax=Isfahan virus TaxID=290008 RepID=PHOSP_ISFV|nr:phosphoprotein [Isfahan virus]Q5K2K6.1 RecName: Full=Phosphoprotein; Short=Protein P; AltName: Full=Protein M1 [Isfahan virus]CAH17545.1 phosphoprotein [Isfahan virus]